MAISLQSIGLSPSLGVSKAPTSPAYKTDIAAIINAMEALINDINNGIIIDDLEITGNLDVGGTIDSVGTITSTTGDIVATAGNVVVTAGDVQTDTINETNPGAGVTVDSVVLKDGQVVVSSGATLGTGVTEVAIGDGANFVSTLSFTDIAFATIPAGGALAVGYLLYTFPDSVVVTDVTSMDVAFTGDAAIQADTPDVGIGSVIGVGAVATLDGTPAFEDYITGQTAADVNGTPVVATLLPTAGTSLIMDAGGAKTFHLNAAATWSDTGAITATGSIVIKWTRLRS